MLFLLFQIVFAIQQQEQLLLQTGTMGLGDELSKEVDRIKVSLKLQNKALAKELAQATSERADNISDLRTDIKTILDKLAYVTDTKMTKINDRVQEHIYQTEAISLIIIMDQLDKKVQELVGIKQQIKQLKAKIPRLSDKCSKFYTCYDCLQDEACGWCSMDDKCVEGDDKGPLKVACNFYSYKQCNGRQCHKYKTCAVCIADPSCGWCVDDNRYMSGCLQQPYDYKGCPKSGWFHLENRQNQCPEQLRKVYDEEFDENAYWSKPLDDTAYMDEEQSNEQDKNNALNGSGGLEQSESKTEYNKKQQQVANQIKQLEELAKEVQKEIDALQKRYEETVNWLDKFNKGEEGEGEQEQQPEQAQEEQQAEQEQQPEDKKEQKKQEKAKKKEEKRQSEEEKKKQKEEKKKKEEEEKKKKQEEKKKQDEIRKKKKQEEDERKKKQKAEEEEKRKQLQEDIEQKQEDQAAEEPQQNDQEQEAEQGGESEEKQNKEDEQQKQEEGGSESSKSTSGSKKSTPSQKKGQKGGASKEQQESNEQEAEDTQQRELPDDYFREPELQSKRWEDFYNGNFIQDDEIDFGTMDVVDDFYNPYM